MIQMAEETYRTNDKFAKLWCKCYGEVKKHYYISLRNYDLQMSQPNKGWRCPKCGTYPCVFDDAFFELPYKP